MSIYQDPKREHDSFYKDEDHFTNPKEYFKQTGNIFLEKINTKKANEDLDFLDIGCAAGDFLRYMDSISSEESKINFYGTDVMDDLLNEAKKRFPKGKFDFSDLSKQNLELKDVFKTKFDFISMLSVHMIFDELFWVDNVVNSLKEGGIAIIWGLFNPYPYDLIMRVKKSGENHYEPGWNVHSKKSILNRCNLINVNCNFIDFEPDINLSRDPKDGLRSWSIKINAIKTLKTANEIAPIFESNRKRIFTSATRIIHDFSFCLIEKN